MIELFTHILQKKKKEFRWTIKLMFFMSLFYFYSMILKLKQIQALKAQTDILIRQFNSGHSKNFWEPIFKKI